MQFDELSRRLSGIEKASRKGSSIRKLYRLIFMPEIWQEAYANIYANKGALTFGINSNTLDGFTMKRACSEGETLSITSRSFTFSPILQTTTHAFGTID